MVLAFWSFCAAKRVTKFGPPSPRLGGLVPSPRPLNTQTKTITIKASAKHHWIQKHCLTNSENNASNGDCESPGLETPAFQKLPPPPSLKPPYPTPQNFPLRISSQDYALLCIPIEGGGSLGRSRFLGRGCDKALLGENMGLAVKRAESFSEWGVW